MRFARPGSASSGLGRRSFEVAAMAASVTCAELARDAGGTVKSGCRGPAPGCWKHKPQLRRLYARLAHRLDLDLDVDARPDQEAPGLQRLVVGQAEVAAVDVRAGREAGALAAPGVLGAALALHLEHHLAGRPGDGQVARDAHPVVAQVLDLAAAEGEVRVLLHIEEVG